MSSSKNGLSMSDFHQKTEELETLQKDVVRFEGKVERLERQLSEARDELSSTRRRVTSLSTEVDGLIRRAMVDLQKGPNAASNRSSLIAVIAAAMRESAGNGGQQSFDVDPPAAKGQTTPAPTPAPSSSRRDATKTPSEPAGDAGEAGDAGTAAAAA